MKPAATSSQTGNHYVAPGDFYTIYDMNSLISAGITGTTRLLLVMHLDERGHAKTFGAFEQGDECVLLQSGDYQQHEVRAVLLHGPVHLSS